MCDCAVFAYFINSLTVQKAPLYLYFIALYIRKDPDYKVLMNTTIKGIEVITVRIPDKT